METQEEQELPENNLEFRTYTKEGKQRVLYEYHNAPLEGHQGIERTLNRIRLEHNWKGIITNVKNYISLCD